MTLSDLVRAVAVAGEQSMQATREAYARERRSVAPSGRAEDSRQPSAGHRGVARYARSEAVAAQDARAARGVGRSGHSIARGESEPLVEADASQYLDARHRMGPAGGPGGRLSHPG